jgi:hypothetical protein
MPGPEEVQSIGPVWFRHDGEEVVFLAPPTYARLMTLFGARQDRGGRWLLDRARAERLIERLRRHAPREHG